MFCFLLLVMVVYCDLRVARLVWGWYNTIFGGFAVLWLLAFVSLLLSGFVSGVF